MEVAVHVTDESRLNLKLNLNTRSSNYIIRALLLREVSVEVTIITFADIQYPSNKTVTTALFYYSFLPKPKL
jgi:hypothetical protein